MVAVKVVTVGDDPDAHFTSTNVTCTDDTVTE